MARVNDHPPRPRDGVIRGLIPEDHSDIRIVPAKERDWWSRLSRPARIRVAAKRGKKWTDAETAQLIRANPTKDDYYTLGETMSRTPGSLRIRRSHMIHLLKDEHGRVASATAYFADPKANHRYADIGQVYRVLRELGILDLPVNEQFDLAQHLKQPSGSWRGDHTSVVLRERRAAVTAVKDAIAKVRRRRRTSPTRKPKVVQSPALSKDRGGRRAPRT